MCVCAYAWMCGRVQKADWDIHKTECFGIQRIHSMVPEALPSDTIFLVARLVTLSRKSISVKQQLDYLSKKMAK